MPDGNAADRAGPQAAEPLAEHDALEPGVVNRPDRDDLAMLRPAECLIDPETRKRRLAEDTADGEDQIAPIAKGDMMPRRSDQPIARPRQKSRLERLDRNSHQPAIV